MIDVTDSTDVGMDRKLYHTYEINDLKWTVPDVLATAREATETDKLEFPLILN